MFRSAKAGLSCNRIFAETGLRRDGSTISPCSILSQSKDQSNESLGSLKEIVLLLTL
jgi:hypothetical protein